MKASLLLSSVFVATTTVASASEKPHPVREDMVRAIEEAGTSWKPRAYSENHLRHIPASTIHGQMLKGNLGVTPFSAFSKKVKKNIHHVADQLLPESLSLFHHSDQTDYLDIDQTLLKTKLDDMVNLPSAFSWKEEMPECLGPIEDQGECGSCWAFASSGLLADRFCIHTNGEFKTRFSVQEMVNCNYENFGCAGGFLMPSIDYLQIEGVVPHDCVRYNAKAKACFYQCEAISHEVYKKYYCETGSLRVLSSQAMMMRDIMDNGPIMVSLMIFEDFMNFGSGIYKHVAGDEIGGHAMKMIGWGTDPVEGKYWILQNQWSDDWGENGFVNIKFGEIGIDSVGLSCMPELEQKKK